MFDLSAIDVEAYQNTGDDINLSGDDLWGIALDQRAFGPHQLIVVTARRDGLALGLAHCTQTEPPELALKYCLAALHHPTAVAVAYSDEPVSTELPNGLSDRLHTAREVAQEFGVQLLDWIMCDDIQMRSLSMALEEDDHSWETPDTDPPTPAPRQRTNPKKRSPHRARRSPPKGPR